MGDRGLTRIAGVDEVGRGPLAGPVLAAAVVLPEALPPDGLELLRDSKQLSAGQRERAAEYIREHAVTCGFALTDAAEIDALGIVPATRQAMKRALSGLVEVPDHVLVDAVHIPDLSVPQESLIKGDSVCRSIAAASIIAKVERDRLMAEQYDGEHPGYGFASHKGYGTARHLAALTRLGPTPIHRRSFAPVRRAIFESGLWPDLPDR
ncbi:MAG: ribonuclease HII [Chloroflexota bacterium]